MLPYPHVAELVKFETEFNVAVENRLAARQAADLADFRFHATLKVCEHAINLQNALKRNRFFEDAELYAPVHRMLVKTQLEAQDAHRNAQEAYELAHKTARVCFYAMQDARKSAGLSAPENEPGTTGQIMLKDI
jgi:hypothetical protein